ncbi:helix-turn-helix transcriptional regulator [bacterium]|nr:helix-turn-helix transcriptional regulator [bacterium]
MGKRVNSVLQSVKEISTTKSFKKKFAEEVQNKSVAKFLFSLRCGHKLTQKQLAGKIRCSQGRISKIESSCNRELTIKDLMDYGNALNLQLEVGYQNKNARIVDLIKCHAFKIKEYLEKLVGLVKGDEIMAAHVLKFHLEAYDNITNFILKNIPDLHKKSLKPFKEPVHISTPLDDELKMPQEKELIKA